MNDSLRTTYFKVAALVFSPLMEEDETERRASGAMDVLDRQHADFRSLLQKIRVNVETLPDRQGFDLPEEVKQEIYQLIDTALEEKSA